MEEAVYFKADKQKLFGILHLPNSGENEIRENAASKLAAGLSPTSLQSIMLMVVGGPQTRVGSHRSYTLIARELCSRGIPILRFDYVGIGDSEGAYIGFSEAGLSLEAAIQYVYIRFPTLKKVVLWALCDGSAACALNVKQLNTKVNAMILCNPYVHSQEGQAKAFLRHYYLQRILDKFFWKKLVSFEINPVTVTRSLLSLLKKASGKPAKLEGVAVKAPVEASLAKQLKANVDGPSFDPHGLGDKVCQGMESFTGNLNLVLSGEDLTAKEFEALFTKHKISQKRPKGTTKLYFVPGADHTFTESKWKHSLCEISLEAWNAV